MPDEVRALSEELARDPASPVFLRLGELLRVRGQLEAAAKVALAGLEHHPNSPDAHDLYARILADGGEVQRAADEWSLALALDPRHVGAHKGMGFVHFQRGDLDRALDHLEAALAADPTDRSVWQALQTVRAAAAQAQAAPPPPPLAATRPAVFVGLEGAEEGLLLVDAQGRVLAGGLVGREGTEVADQVAAYLAGVAQEAERTTRLLELGEWQWVMTEADQGQMHLSAPAEGTLLLVVRDKGLPAGRLARLAERAAAAARRWLESEAL